MEWIIFTQRQLDAARVGADESAVPGDRERSNKIKEMGDNAGDVWER